MLMLPQQTIPAPQPAEFVHITPLPASDMSLPLLLPLVVVPVSSPPASPALPLLLPLLPASVLLLLLLLELQAAAVATAHDATTKIIAFFM